MILFSVIEESSLKCNSNCNCNYKSYEPICYKENTYFNPCTAGCQFTDGDVYGKVIIFLLLIFYSFLKIANV